MAGAAVQRSGMICLAEPLFGTSSTRRLMRGFKRSRLVVALSTQGMMRQIR